MRNMLKIHFSDVTDALNALKDRYSAQKTVVNSLEVLAVGHAAIIREQASKIVANTAENTEAKAALLAFADEVEADRADTASKIVEATVAEDEPEAPVVP